jgi:membrane protease YdiL (CAAX protease family)
VAPLAENGWTRTLVLVLFCLSVPTLIPLEAWAVGIPAWIGAAVLVLRDPDPAYRRRLCVLLGSVAILACAPIETDTSNRGFLLVGSFFLAAILLPALVLGRTDPHVIDFRIWPYRSRWLDVLYVSIAVPLAYFVIRWYFFDVNPYMPTQWYLPAEYDSPKVWRLVIGLNSVGIWDELFFVNICFSVLRSVHRFWVANLVQAVVYAAVLYDMAFIGVGPILVYAFALTQGSMYEESKCLLWVLIVHLVIDAILLETIIAHYYPGHGSFHWF